MPQSPFTNNLISRIQHIDPSEIEAFLTQLVKEKDFFNAIFDSIQEGIFVVDREERIVFANEALRGLLGLRRGRLVHEHVRRVLKVKALQVTYEEFLADPHHINQREFEVLTPHPRIYAVSVVPVETQDDELTHSVWILSDQTESHRRASERQQYESIRSLATLVAGIAHEIKNPLNSLNIHAQLIARGAREYVHKHDGSQELERLVRSSNVMIEEIQRLTRIVDQFIKAARPARLAPRPTNVNDLISAVGDLIRPECHGRRIELTLDLEATLPVIQVDAEQIQQAILNVARNAIEAMNKEEGRIHMRTVTKADHVLVEIEDNGCGIPDEDRLKIFEPYHTTKFNGTGLGLMVVFRIINAHRGEIGLDSRMGEGTTFKIALPLDERPIRLLEDLPVGFSQTVQDGSPGLR